MSVLQEQISKNEKLIAQVSPLVESGDISMNEYINQLKELDDLKLQAYTFEGRIATLKAEEQSEIDRISSEYTQTVKENESSEYERKLAQYFKPHHGDCEFNRCGCWHYC